MRSRYRSYRFMSPMQFLIVLALGLGVIGGGAYFTYHAFHPYDVSATFAPVVYVHPLMLQIEKARKLQIEGKLVDARKLLRDQLRIYPNAPQSPAARDLLGDINTQMFFSKDNLFGKTEYIVKRGDTLWRIAHKLDSTPAEILRVNELQSDLLHPGDQLVIPDSDFTLTLDLPNERAVVHHGDGFFKQYPIVDMNLPHSNHARVTMKVKATVFWKDGRIVSPETERDREEASARIHFGDRGYVLYGVDDESVESESALEVSEKTTGKVSDGPRPTHGIALLKDDLRELLRLLRHGAPVTIVRAHK